MTTIPSKPKRLSNYQKLQAYCENRKEFWEANYTLNVSLIVDMIGCLPVNGVKEYLNIIKRIGKKFSNSRNIKRALREVLQEKYFSFKYLLYHEFRSIVDANDEDLLKYFVNFVIGDINVAKSWFKFIVNCKCPSKYFHIIAKYVKPEDISDRKQFNFTDESFELVEFFSYYFNEYKKKMDLEIYTLGFCHALSNTKSYKYIGKKIDSKLNEILSYINQEKKYRLVDSLFKTYKSFFDENHEIDLLQKFNQYLGNKECPMLNAYYKKILKQKRNEIIKLEHLCCKQ